MYNAILFFIKRIFCPFLYLLTMLPGISGQTVYKKICIETSYGSMNLVLYNETPMHSENFVDLVKKGLYDGVLFHRVINNFMIQAGDLSTRSDLKGQAAGSGDITYTIPAEFHPALYHKKGALAAARQGDNVNPERASSGSQFYIVQGTKFTKAQLDQMEQQQMHIRFTPEQRRIYTEVGGTPHLDYSYTVFGQVVDGLDVIEKIAAVPTDQNDRPLEDIKIKIRIID
jgi:peptidyl-prolyl cis-trans isomerase B (cyclophilin B)